MKYITLLFLLVSLPALAVDEYITHDEDSVVLGPICLYDATDGVSPIDVDFDYSSLNIDVLVTGGTLTQYQYSGGDIDDGPGDGSWGNPTTDAVEIDSLNDVLTTPGSQGDCILLSVRDEVFAISNATRWAFHIGDGGSTLMDREYVVVASVADDILTDTEELVTDVNAVLVDTAEIGAAGAGLTEAGGTGDQFTATMSADVVSISGDSTAADNLESYTDGTTNQPVNTECMNDSQITGDGTSGTPWTGNGAAC